MRWLRRIRRRKAETALSCKVRVGKYTYTIEAEHKDRETDPIILLWHCQTLARQVEQDQGDSINRLHPEAVAEDWFEDRLLHGYGCYRHVSISWDEVDNAKET